MTDNTQEEELLTVLEVAKILRLDSTTIRRYIKLGLLEAVILPSQNGLKQIYRIRRETLEKLLGNVYTRQLCREIGIDLNRSHRYVADLKDHVLIVDLNKEENGTN